MNRGQHQRASNIPKPVVPPTVPGTNPPEETTQRSSMSTFRPWNGGQGPGQEGGVEYAPSEDSLPSIPVGLPPHHPSSRKPSEIRGASSLRNLPEDQGIDMTLVRIFFNIS